jgi:DNA-binding beta-propeller fold protein YncE
MRGRFRFGAAMRMALVAVLAWGCSGDGDDSGCDGSAAGCGIADASTSSPDGAGAETGRSDTASGEPSNDPIISDAERGDTDAAKSEAGDAQRSDVDPTIDSSADLSGIGPDADSGAATDGADRADVSVDSTTGSDADPASDVVPDHADASDGPNGEGGICSPGAVQSRGCGKCGAQLRTCTVGSWSDWTACSDEGVCLLGDTESEACGSDVGICKNGTRSRSCSSSCQWNAWSACGGAYVAPSLEICNDGLDNDCSGTADEGCSCAPVAMGGGGSLAVTGKIVKLIPDPQGCFIYGLDTSSPSSIVVFDTKLKTEMKRIPLTSLPVDIDVSPNGAWLVASMGDNFTIAVVDKSLWTASLVAAASVVYPLEVNDAGYVYYAPSRPFGSFGALRGIDLGIGVSSDVELTPRTFYGTDLELDPRRPYLYRGESGISGGHLEKNDMSTSPPTVLDRDNWNEHGGFSENSWHIYLGAKHIYYARHSIAADDLKFVKGKTDARVYAEDEMGTFAVSNAGVIDAELVRTVARLPQTADAATLTADAATLSQGDHEIWYFNAAAGRIYYASVRDYLDGKTLGERALPPLPLSSYSITKLVADPVRPRLYALDSSRELVLAIDSSTMSVIGAIAVSSAPRDIEVDRSGNYLYVAHLEANRIGQIDLSNWRFARLIPAPREFGDVVPLGDTRIAGLDSDQWNTPTLMQVATGTVTDHKRVATYFGAIAATSDGSTLFVGDSGSTGNVLTRYAVADGKLTIATKSATYGGATRSVVATRDGTGVYWAGQFFDGTNLAVVRYLQPDPILVVTPDGKLAMSATKVYRVADGTPRGDLTLTGTIQAVSGDGTKLYVVNGGTIGVVDLTAY